MRRVRTLLLLLLAAALLAASVSADILIEPDDDFYRRHAGDCYDEFRAYTVNGREGYAALWESPTSHAQRETVANGERVSGSWHYADGAGEVWCAVGDGMTDQGYESIRGWVRTSDCVPVPDYISFREAHGDEFAPCGSGLEDAFDGVDEVALWAYPGSGKVVSQVDAQWFRDSGAVAGQFDTCWTDVAGRVWGFSVYCYGMRNTWVCLSDPGNDGLAADPDVLPEQPPLIPASTPAPPSRGGLPTLAVVLVAAAVLLSALLLAVLYRRKRPQAKAG